MLFVAAAGNKHVVQIHENATKALANHVHQSLKSLCGILETEWHLKKFIQAKWSDDGCFGNVVVVDRDLMITLNQINFREMHVSATELRNPGCEGLDSNLE